LNVLKKRNTVFTFNKPSLFKVVDVGKKRKRRKILKPLTHVPLREREIDSSFDEDVQSSDDEHEAKDEVVEKEEVVNAPEKGAESGVNNTENFDDLNFVYKNQETGVEVEKPFRTAKPKIQKGNYLSATNAETINLGPVVRVKSKEIYKFNLPEVKKYLDSLDDYEKTKLLNEREGEKLDAKQCGCSIF